MKPALIALLLFTVGSLSLALPAYAELTAQHSSKADALDDANEEEAQNGQNGSLNEVRDADGEYSFRPFYSFSSGPIVYFTPGLNGPGSKDTHDVATSGDGFGMRILTYSGFSMTLFGGSGSADVTSTTSTNPKGYKLLSATAAERVISVEYNWHQHNFGEASQWIGFLGAGYHLLSGDVMYRGTGGNEDSRIKFTGSGKDLILGGEYVFSNLINLGWYMRIGWNEKMRAESHNPNFYLSKGNSSGGGIYVGYQF